jgi:antitoxin component YwqK of YwqJK toxin-antitoxin module
LNNDSVSQLIWLSPVGKVEQIINFQNGVKNGHFYSFYESGALKSHRFLSNSKEILYGADYYDDSISILKSSLHFNNKGELFYKKNFNKNGSFESEEGNEN